MQERVEGEGAGGAAGRGIPLRLHMRVPGTNQFFGLGQSSQTAQKLDFSLAAHFHRKRESFQPEFSVFPFDGASTTTTQGRKHCHMLPA